MVQDDKLVLNWHTGAFQFFNGADDPLGRQVTGWVVILPNHQDAGMMALTLLE